MHIKFCGANREVTGSSHLLTLDSGYTILLDCGLYQGYADEFENFNNEWLFDPKQLDCLILSHAHIDHTGRVPKLYKDGFRGEVFCTHATRSLCAIMLMDSAAIQEKDAEYANKKGYKDNEPLYTKEDVTGVLHHYTSLSYDRWHYVADGVRVMFRDAGHILGSASVTLEITEPGKEKVIFGFTGDIGRPDRPILRNPVPMPECDFLICESTYGDAKHEATPEQTDRLLEIVKEVCVKNRGKLLIPAFSVGRTQEIVYMLDQLESEGKLPDIPVYVDSPLAVNATQVFAAHPECYDTDLTKYQEEEGDPWGFRNLTYVRSVEMSKKLNETDKPCIIISASGMMNAGRIRHHLFNSMENSRNGLLMVGYCSPNTPGGRIRAGAESLTLFGEHKQLLMQVHTMHSFSAHGDQDEMFDFIKNQMRRVKTLFLVHGEYETQLAFQDYLTEKGFDHIEIPALGDTVQLR